MASRLTFEWLTRRDGNDGYVLEKCGHYQREFGPMPPHAVPAFATARRRVIAMMMDRLGANYVLEDAEQFFRDANTRPAQKTGDHEYDLEITEPKGSA